MVLIICKYFIKKQITIGKASSMNWNNKNTFIEPLVFT